jgi:uncharacterized protein YecT (DUF1311 family)
MSIQSRIVPLQIATKHAAAEVLMRALLIVLISIFAAHAVPAAVTAQTLKADTKFYKISINYPKTGNSAIDADLRAWAQELFDDFKKYGAEAEEDALIAKTGGHYEAELNFTVERDDAQVLSLVFHYYTFTGGAHPNTVIYARNYLKPDGRRVFIAELLGHEGVKRLSAIAIAEINKLFSENGGSGDDEWVARGAGPQADNFEAYVWKKNSLLLIFSSYQVAPYAAGPQEIEIPLSQLKGFVRSDPRAPMPSYDCLRAGSAIEKAMCADWALARADRKMAEDYAASISNAYEDAKKAKIKSAQRAWLKRRDGICGALREQASLKACLMPLLEMRRAELNAPSP